MPLPEGIKIRSARRGDRDSIYRVLAEAGVALPPIEQSNTLSWIVSHPETEVLLAVDPLDRGVGMVSLAHRPQLSLGGRVAAVSELVVAAAMRRKGIGGELLERVRERARILGCRRLEVAAGPPEARAFLAKRGFVENDVRVFAWENPSGR